MSAMALLKLLFEKPANLTVVSRYTTVNGYIYLGVGVLLIIWPGAVQTLFRESAFVGHEEGLIRAIGLAVVVIGWLYLFGSYANARQFAAASVVDRLIFVPIVLVPLAIAGVFPRFLLSFAVLDATLAVGAWVLLDRKG